jgi:hypothetical protein
MASWGFTCKNCGHAIEHADIDDSLWNYFFPAKPVLPVEGISKTCPNCSATFTYQPVELVYERV